MELSYRGGNCVEIVVKKDTIIIDGALAQLGLKDVTAKNAVYIATQPEFNPQASDGVVINSPGEYEVREVSVKGIAASRMIDGDDSRQTTIYRIVYDGIRVVIVGHVQSPLSDEQLELIGVVDIAIIPVGGGGYTLDGHQASAVIRQLDPKVIIPTHYADKLTKYEVPQAELELFISELGIVHEKTERYKVKNGVLPEVKTVVELVRY